MHFGPSLGLHAVSVKFLTNFTRKDRCNVSTVTDELINTDVISMYMITIMWTGDDIRRKLKKRLWSNKYISLDCLFYKQSRKRTRKKETLMYLKW